MTVWLRGGRCGNERPRASRRRCTYVTCSPRTPLATSATSGVTTVRPTQASAMPGYSTISVRQQGARDHDMVESEPSANHRYLDEVAAGHNGVCDAVAEAHDRQSGRRARYQNADRADL